MKKFQREKYTLKSYDDERYKLEITNDETNISNTIYSSNYEELYIRAKKEAENGNHCELWQCLYEFIY